MSIIHEALKKAEKERQQKAASLTKEETILQDVELVSFLSPLEAEQDAVIEAHTQKVSSQLKKVKPLPHFRGNIKMFLIIGAAFLVVLGVGIVIYIKAVPSQPGIVPAHVQGYRNGRQVAPSSQPRSIKKETAVSPAYKLANMFSLNQEKFVCTGIAHDGVAPIAIINGIVLEEGDKISNAVVGRIETNQVILKVRGKRLVVPLQIGK
jgi:hypothetical protein